MLNAITASTDLTGPGKGKRVASWSFQNTGTAATIELRDGSVTGTPYITIPLAVGSTTPTFLTQSYGKDGPLFVSGLYVKVTGGTVVGNVDLV
jgi:hypothetical protein